jgi:hypothetical protein
MNVKQDVEDLLVRLRVGPDARVKRAVLSRYAELYGRGRGEADGLGVWRRPVPLYVAAAIVLLATGLSFVGGLKVSRSERVQGSFSPAMQDSLIGEAFRQSAQYAPSDVL